MARRAQEITNVEFRLHEFLPFQFVTVAEMVFKTFAEAYNDTVNLTVPEFRVLAVVGEHGTLSPTQTGHVTAMDKVKVSRAAQTLVAKKLLRQSQDPTDGRGRLLRLTKKGAATLRNATTLAADQEAELFGDLTEHERATLIVALKKLADSTAGERGSHP